MKEIEFDSFKEKIRAPEGSVNFYYGRIGSGKTYAATADILDLLAQGHIVYANWRINWEGIDERDSRTRRIIHYIFGRYVRQIPRENFHYVPPEEFTAGFISRLSDCFVFVDEGQNLLDSYEKTDFSKEKRKLIQYTRHFHRTINIIAQRPTSVQVTARAQVNRFYKCSRRTIFGFHRFYRQEFQDMVQENVDETAEPISTKTYWGRSAIYRAYDSKYMRENVPYVYPLQSRWILELGDLWGKLIRASADKFSPDVKDVPPF